MISHDSLENGSSEKKICRGQERKVVTYLFFVAFFREMTLFKMKFFILRFLES